ncbi:class I SAM-dependent methyltransferase [Luteolibacter pohnpeiensis]|uniref:Class I SAM-dependent methyltransferase n=1 Tax=Luteolibacter pohnpeiensis TaxID=454153 RepID=A0A934S3C5_9BACT|nr:cyclopropane-fatty-acyl-phospholipid synthase family protein [Luteolibacter pohnpeiensis]MBK1882415.1 class I SAM-dependent methyltransferase [Luteolibacter pohnpeiensis]
MKTDTFPPEVVGEPVCDNPANLKFSSFAEKMVIRLLEKMPFGGLRLEYSDSRVRHFGKPGAPITARISIQRESEFFKRCLFYGNIGLGEAYTDGLWETNDIQAVISWFILNMQALQGSDTSSSKLPGVNILKILSWLTHLKRENSIETSRRNISEHYDLGNEFYSLWLDPSMTYSCARFTQPDQDLESAQAEKYDALCRKLKLQPTDHVLEIGCGWGGFSLHAAKNYGCRITGVTISEAQAKMARARIEEAGFSEQIEIRIQDYRHITGTYDKIVSIEMLEAVGDKYHESFFSKCNEVLTSSGLLGIQMITVPDCRYQSLKEGVDWIQKKIFPGSLLLSVGRINQVLAKTSDLFSFHLEDLGADYAKTLSLWHERFNEKLPAVRNLGFDDSFIRTWNYYLKYCEAGFLTRNISVVQAVYTRPNNPLLAVEPEKSRVS